MVHQTSSLAQGLPDRSGPSRRSDCQHSQCKLTPTSWTLSKVLPGCRSSSKAMTTQWMVSWTNQLAGVLHKNACSPAAPCRAMVCHWDACSLAQVQLCLAPLRAPAAARGPEGAATDLAMAAAGLGLCAEVLCKSGHCELERPC